MYWFSEAKGMASSRGRSLPSASRSRLFLAAATSRAASVGSPVMVHSPFSLFRAASLHRAAATTSSRSGSGSCSTGWPSTVNAPSGA